MRMTMSDRPTPSQVAAAHGKSIDDVLATDLRVVFCGINPGLYTAAVGHHFARPGNRFWPTLHRSGWTPRQLRPDEERQLLDHGCGLTNLVPFATATAAELTTEDLRKGARTLRRKLARYRPRRVAFLGITAYRAAFDRKDAAIGPQPEMIGNTPVWVLPNPSGLNAHYQMQDFVRLFREMREADGN